MMPSRLVLACTLLAALLASASARGQDVTLPEFERVVLDNGAVLILNEKHDVPLVAVSAVLRGGAVTDPPALVGLADLFAGLLEKGAGERDAAEFAEAVDSVGGELGAQASLEDITITGEFLARDAGLMVELLADMLLRPALAADELNRLRDRSINFIRAAKDNNLNALPPIYGHAFLFGEHPYGNPVNGSETSLAAISRADIVDYYEQQVGADRLTVAVSGDFDMAAMRAALEAGFGGWRTAGSSLPEIPAVAQQSGRRVLLIDKPGATQTYFWLGNIGVSHGYDQRAALNLANTLFGGRFTSMLNTALRISSGLSYGARSALTRPSQPGSVAISSYTQTGSTVEAIDMALGVLAQLRDGAIDEEMLASAQNYVLGQFPTALETASQLAGQLASLDAFGLPPSYIDDYGSEILGTDTAALDAVIADVYPSADNLVFVLLGDAVLIRDAVTKYGPVTEIPITAPRFRVPDQK